MTATRALKRFAGALIALVCVAPSSSAAIVFNLRVSLEHGYYVAGTVTVDGGTGLVTGESSTLYRNGLVLSNFSAATGQGPFAPGGGVAPSYLFSSSGSNGYLFVGALPGTSLVGYAGGELCSQLSVVRCAFTDVFLGGSDIANATQGVLLPATDSIETFSLIGAFENGDNLVGTVVIDTTAGYVLDQRATLFSRGVIIEEYFSPLAQSIFAPGGGGTASYLFQSSGAGEVSLNLGVPGTSLVGYGGGDLCATGNGLTCAFSDIFLTSATSSNAITARLIRTTAVPAPSSLPLVAIGLVACGLACRTRVRNVGRQSRTSVEGP